MILRLREQRLDLGRPVVMGVLNVTPDSFSDGGRFPSVAAAVEHGLRMVEEGAALIDVGGESARPGADPVGVATELERVVPVLEGLAAHTPVPLSIDTRKPEVMEAAIAAGASLVNDVSALTAPGALDVVARTGAAVCLMHMRGEPGTMQADPKYLDVVAEVRQFLADCVRFCNDAGIADDRLVVDPGIGFGKRLEHNLALLAHLRAMQIGGCAVLVGVSRKSMFGSLLGRAVDDRLPGSLAVATAAVLAGARIIRTHDVRPTVDAVRTAQALVEAGFDS